jgi:hypothetical protein
VRYGAAFAPCSFVSPSNSDSLLLIRSKISEIGITANASLGNSISSIDFDFPNLYNGPPETFCEHNATIHLSMPYVISAGQKSFDLLTTRLMSAVGTFLTKAYGTCSPQVAKAGSHARSKGS